MKFPADEGANDDQEGEDRYVFERIRQDDRVDYVCCDQNFKRELHAGCDDYFKFIYAQFGRFMLQHQTDKAEEGYQDGDENDHDRDDFQSGSDAADDAYQHRVFDY